MTEVSKDKPPGRAVESNTTQFMKALESVESGLLKHINYLTTVSTGCFHNYDVMFDVNCMVNIY